MSFYPEKISEHFLAPKNCGVATVVNGLGTIGSPICGAVTRITLAIENEASIISEARFQAAGCGYMIAAASVMTEAVEGLRLGEAAALCVEDINEMFGAAPPEKAHCYKLVLDAIVAAAVDYRSRRLEDWSGDDCLVCTCFGISESGITSKIREHALTTVDEVGNALSAGRGCGSCRPLIQEIIDTLGR